MIVARGIVRSGILDLVGRHRRRLEADERPQRQRRRGGQEADARAVGRERLVVAAVDEEQADDADDGQRHELQDGRDELYRAALAGAEDVRARQQPDEGDADERAEQLVRAGGGPEHGEVADERDRDGRVAGPDRDPVAPGGLEADEVAERALRIGVGTAGARERAAEVGEDQREQDGAGAGEGPADHRNGSGLGSERGGKQEDARADHVADHERGGHPEAHRPLELAVRGGGGGLGRGRSVGASWVPLSRASRAARPFG